MILRSVLLSVALLSLACGGPERQPSPNAGAQPDRQADSGSGPVTTVAAWSVIQGFADGKGGYVFTGLRARIAIAPDGSVYFSDYSNHRIRKLATDGTVTTIAGSGPVISEETYVPYIGSFADGPADLARFAFPTGLVVAEDGSIFVADARNNRIRQVAPDGSVSTYAGTGVGGFKDGQRLSAEFSGPEGLALDESGNLYVADYVNNAVRKIWVDGRVTTIAGGRAGFIDGLGATAAFQGPTDVAIDRSGHLYVTDNLNGAVRKIAQDGVVSTLARGLKLAGSDLGPVSVAVDTAGNVYVPDYDRHVVLRITPDGVVRVFAGASGQNGNRNASLESTQFYGPDAVAYDGRGGLWVHDARNYEIRLIPLQ